VLKNKLLISACLISLVSSVAVNAVELKTVPASDAKQIIHLNSSPICTWGDLDIIALEIREHLQKQIPTKILLSIESFDKSILTTAETNIEKVFKGEDAELKPVALPVPTVTKDTLVGVFICKDSTGDNACRNKNLDDYKNIFNRHIIEMKDGKVVSAVAPDQIDPTKAAKDSIYYFQPAILGPDGIRIVVDSFSDESLNQFKNKIITDNLTDESSASFIVEAVRLVNSTALQVSDNKLILDLASSDQGKCSAEINSKRMGTTQLPQNKQMYDNSIAEAAHKKRMETDASLKLIEQTDITKSAPVSTVNTQSK
jgi:hypothetical protein